jgi:hypothetical protein
LSLQANSPVFYPPDHGLRANPVRAVIHPARGQSNVRYGRGVGYDIVFKVDEGEEVWLYPQTRTYDLMRKYEWVWIQSTTERGCHGWVSLLIPFEQMFTITEPVNAK